METTLPLITANRLEEIRFGIKAKQVPTGAFWKFLPPLGLSISMPSGHKLQAPG